MTCPNCGTQNEQGQRFCDNCGHALAGRCSNCGEENRSGARFCRNCGNSLTETAALAEASAATPQAAERRLVSVLFADIVGFTPFAEERDPEAVREVLERYFAIARTVIERHGGTVEKFIGDAVMAVWGTPTAREDDAERAVRAALELLPQVKTVGPSIQARAAVMSGEAAVDRAATGQAMVAGDLVNTAARLQSFAAPDTVLVGESAMRASSAAIAFEPATDATLKGKTAPVATWRALRVVAERGGRARSEAIEPPFVGRDAELALLKELLHATQTDGRARLISISGPGGIGKSRLAWELEKYVDGLVGKVYWHRGRSPSYGDGITFWALGEMVRRRAGLAEGDDEATTRRRIGQTIAEFVDDESERRWIEPALLALLGVEPATPTGEAGAAAGRENLFAAWRTFFERIAERAPVVLLFEDLQWADSGLLDFMDHLLEWSKGSPITVLGLARPELLERRPDFGGATRQFTSMALEPLSPAAMNVMLAGLVPGLPAEQIAAIVGRADGIPLYAVETIRMLVADGRLEESDGAYRLTGPLGELKVPDTLRSLIASRLDALEADDRVLLQRAAVLGQTFAIDTLAAITATNTDDLGQRLRRLVKREILELDVDPRSPERGQYGFVQSLIREVAYGTLSRRERRERHLAAARHFEALGTDELAGALASHYLAAYRASERGPEADAVAAQARLALRGAAERARALGAYAQAATHLGQALEVAVADADRAELLERQADALVLNGNYTSAAEAAEASITAYRQANNPTGAARVEGVVAQSLINRGRSEEAVDGLTNALASLGDEPEIRAHLESNLSRANMRALRADEAIAAADRALTIAESRGMVNVVAEALNNKGSALQQLGRWREGVALLEGAVKLAEQAGDPGTQVRALNNLASLVAEDDMRRAVAIVDETISIARRLGVRSMLNFLIRHRVALAHPLGVGWDQAVSELVAAEADAADEADRAQFSSWTLYFGITRGEMGVDAADEWGALAVVAQSAQFQVIRLLLRGTALLFAGDPAGAFEESAAAAAMDPEVTPALENAMRAAIWLRDPDKAAFARRGFDALSATGRPTVAYRVWSRAVELGLEGKRAESIATFEEAIRRLHEIGFEFFAAEAVVDGLTVFPDAPELLAHAEAARETLSRLRVKPMLAQLDKAVAAGASMQPVG